ncbi:MAG: PilC/PilY family type IV pilus protein [Rhodocyclaceae bacterium]|nr:PilC/PilY family type IV pilus protein [Rhodocyclaceae bacterium]MDZ4214695.1 PilC/PilY family type IV pilus protein [Rhodocyclaceae bacterium]
MATLNILKHLALVATLAMPMLSNAEDIDLFEGGAAITGAKPNVLIVLDNTANWSRASEWNSTDAEATQGAAQIEAIKTALSVLDANVRVGIMMQSQSGNNAGGYIRFGVREMTTANKDALTAILSGIKPNVGDPAEKISSPNYSRTLREVYQYFSNQTIYGPNDSKRDYTGNGSYNINYTAGNVAGNPLSSIADDSYETPLSATAPCAKNYIIFVGNEWYQSGQPENDGGLSGLPSANTTQIYTTNGGDKKFSDEWTRYLKQVGVSAPCTGDVCADGKVLTYTINVCYKSCITQPQLGVEQESLLKSMAAVGGGRYFRATSTQEIKTALATIFNEVQAVNSVFTSASLPVSVNTQGTYLNQIYMGVFRPDGSGAPRWMGNLKQYKFGLTTDATGADVIFLADKNGNEAVNTQTGFVSPNAASYWTSEISPACSSDPSKGFWCFNPSGVGQDKDLPDGDLVERGGAGQRLRALGPTARTILTCKPDCTSGNAPSAWSTGNAALVSSMTGVTSTVSLSRSGPTVTATTAAALGISATDTVSISGATVAAYNGLKSVTKLSDTQFSFSIAETPPTPATGTNMTVSSGSSTSPVITNLTFDTTPGSPTYGKAIATVGGHGFINGQSITIAGVTGVAKDLVLNGTFTITVIDSNTFSYTPTLATTTTETPAAINRGAGGTATCGGTTYNIASIRRDAGNDIVTVVTTTSNNANCKMNPSAATVTIADVAEDAAYNTSIALHGVDGTCPNYSSTNNNHTLCYTITRSSTSTPLTPTSPAAGTPQTATGKPTRAIASITRTDGNASNLATVTVTTTSDHGFSGATSVEVVGADATTMNDYNGVKTTAANALAFPAANTITYTLTTGPTANATGTAGKGFTLDASALINWMRGADNREDENSNNDFTDVRASIHGDVLHSRPLVINYGGSTGIYAFYGSNDGTLRAVKGGQADTDGQEAWSFIAPEHYAKLGRLYLNSPLVKFPNTSNLITPTPTARDYFFDGNLGVFQNAALTTTHIFASMRRGGRFIYAFDVSSPTAPEFLWKIANTDSGYSELGQTWSEPKVIPIRKTAGVACSASNDSSYTRALVFGAGYDPTEEDRTAGTVRNPTMGRGIFVVNAETGALIRQINMPNNAVAGIANATKRYSVPSEVATLDISGDGCIDRLYVGDTGANLFRVDIDDANPINWKSYKLAALGDIEGNGGNNDRKILYPPDVVLGFIGGQQVAYVLAGTGDREQPRTAAIHDMFFMIKDTIATGTDPATLTPLKLTDLTQATNFNAATSTLDATLSSFKGWYIDYGDKNGDGTREETGEKTVNAPTTVGGITFFGTNRPMSATEIAARNNCSPDLGIARGYAINFQNATAAFDRDGDGQKDDLFANFAGGGLPPSPVSGVVQIDENKTVRFVIGGGGGGDEGSAIEGTKLQASPSSRRTRVFWYFKKDD